MQSEDFKFSLYFALICNIKLEHLVTWLAMKLPQFNTPRYIKQNTTQSKFQYEVVICN